MISGKIEKHNSILYIVLSIRYKDKFKMQTVIVIGNS